MDQTCFSRQHGESINHQRDQRGGQGREMGGAGMRGGYEEAVEAREKVNTWKLLTLKVIIR